MKKLVSLLLAAILVLAAVFMLAVPALADTGGVTGNPEFFTWATLGTYAGALAITMAFTQLLKGVSFIDKIPTRLFAWLISFLVLFGATYFTGNLTLESAALCVINAVMVGLAANGSYDFIKSIANKPPAP